MPLWEASDSWVLFFKSIYRSELQVWKRVQEWNDEFVKTDRFDST